MLKKKAAKKPPVATLTIRGAGEMTDEERYLIMNWLLKAAADVYVRGKQYTKVFTARYEG